MKTKSMILTLLAFVSPALSHAATFEVLDAKGAAILAKQTVDASHDNVSTLSLRILNEAQAKGLLKLKGDEDGVSKINDLENDTKLISKTEIKAYGWCFSVNGVASETMANDTSMTNDDSVVWYYGYAHYLNGQWIKGCVPAWK